jgi:hypothetical protein
MPGGLPPRGQGQASRGTLDLIPLGGFVPFGKTLGFDNTKFTPLIGDNSVLPGAFAVETDSAQPGSPLVSLTLTKSAARRLPPIT